MNERIDNPVKIILGFKKMNERIDNPVKIILRDRVEQVSGCSILLVS